MKFEELYSFDARLGQAFALLNFEEPTPIQEQAIPLALQDGRDIVARAKTGSGKTAAYLIPIVQALLDKPATGNGALILVPSRELCDQVYKVLGQLLTYCGRAITSVNLGSASEAVQSSLLADSPNVIISTPARARTHVDEGNIDPSGLRYLVLDEADLVLSYGYEDDLNHLASVLPIKKTLQTWLMSATLSEEVDRIKATFCRNVAILKLDDSGDGDENKLVQYYVKCAELDKFLLAYVIFKLNLIKGKTIIFVNDIDRCYRLKLFFEQFGIKSCVLNANLPISSRLHIVDEFNKNIYNLVIATDEKDVIEEDEKDEDVAAQDQADQTQDSGKNKNKKNKKDYSASRGVDFLNVSCVLNFDLPTSSRAYTHRIGRTARANKSGMALSFVVPKELWNTHPPSSLKTARRDEKVLAKIVKSQAKLGRELEPYAFDMKQVESFRYRMEDAFRAVTKVAVREAQVKEIRQELINSDKLERHFEENPEDLNSLRHDKELHPARVQPHLKRVPEYLVNKGTATPIGKVGFHKASENRIRKVRKMRRSKGRKDPLKSFKTK